MPSKKKCCVPSCGVLEKGLFMLPKNLEMRRLWFNAIGCKRAESLSDARICKRHFTVEDLRIPNVKCKWKNPERAWLREGAVPSRNLKEDPYKIIYKYDSYDITQNVRAKRLANRKAKEKKLEIEAEYRTEAVNTLHNPSEIFLKPPVEVEIPGVSMEVEDFGGGNMCVQADLTDGSLKKIAEGQRELIKLRERVKILENKERRLRENNGMFEVQVASLSNQNTLLEQRANALVEKVKILEDKVKLLEANGERVKEDEANQKMDNSEASKDKGSESDVAFESFTSWTLCGTKETVHLPPEVLKQLSGITTITSEDMDSL